jgi:hypothetical protein
MHLNSSTDCKGLTEYHNGVKKKIKILMKSVLLNLKSPGIKIKKL